MRRLALGVVLAVLASPTDAEACSCQRPQPSVLAAHGATDVPLNAATCRR
jgi:hypothetical protein